MPPKGWRKNADGNYPIPNREAEITSIDEILFPRSIVQRLAKDMLSDEENNMSMAKDSLIALQRSATVFVSHIMFHAREISKRNDRKTVNAQDILTALENAEYPGFVPDVRQKTSMFEAALEVKKKAKAASGQTESSEPSTKKLKTDEEVGDLEEEESDLDVTNDNTEELKEDSQMDEDEPEVIEVLETNPIAAISKEEEELEGTIIEEDKTVDIEEEEEAEEEED